MAGPGLTKDAGWEIGVRRTFPVDADRAWAALTGAGLAALLGEGAEVAGAAGGDVRVGGRIVGRVASRTDGSLLRLRMTDWDVAPGSTLQLRVLPARTGVTFSVHHERLDGPDTRARMRERWSAVVDELARLAAG